MSWVILHLANISGIVSKIIKKVLPDGFEPSSSEPKSDMIDPYTTGVEMSRTDLAFTY